MKVKVTSQFGGILTIRPNNGLVEMKPITLASKKSISFKDENEYANYSESISSFKQSGLVSIVTGKETAKSETKVDDKADEQAPELDEIKEKLKVLKEEFDNPETPAKRKTKIKKEVTALKKLAKAQK